MVIAPISPVSFTSPSAATTTARPAAEGFGDALANAVDDVAKTQQAASGLAQQAAAGGSVDPAQLMVATTEASLTLQVTSAVRNRAVEAFGEIMRMQV